MQTTFDFILRNWILIVILGNLLIAVSNVMSKILLSGSVAKPLPPASYAFVTGIWGLLVFGLAFIANSWLGLLKLDFREGFFGLLAGAFFILSLWLYYFVLERNEPSRVVTILVGSAPLFSFFLKYELLDERLSMTQITAFLFLVSGSVLISLKQTSKGYLHLKDLFLVVLAGFGFALGNVLAETGFKLQGFWSGLIWIALGYGLAALVPLILPSARRQIFSVRKSVEKKNVFMFFLEKLFGLFGSFINKFAFTLQTVTLVTALEGVKQFFVLGLAGFFSFKYPRVLKEELQGIILWEKILAAIFVAAGIFLLIAG